MAKEIRQNNWKGEKMKIKNASEQAYFNTRQNKQHQKYILNIATNLYEKNFDEWKKVLQKPCQEN